MEGWMAGKDNLEESKKFGDELKGLLKDSATGLLKEIHDETGIVREKIPLGLRW